MPSDERCQSLVTFDERPGITLENVTTKGAITTDERRKTRAQPKARPLLVER
jgi:hypothetical protein